MEEKGKSNLGMLQTMFAVSTESGKAYMRAMGYEYKPWFRENKQYRNDLCSCGSGKKVKHCHGVTCEYNIKTN